MSGISTGVGIFSGIDTRSLISQLLALEARPKTQAQQRLIQVQTQQASFLDINSALLALKTASAAFNAKRIFNAASATSSNPEAVTASAGTSATPGAFGISVARLVTTHQAISRGFANKDISGLGADELTFETGGGRLDSETTLSELNAGEGIERGKIRITDSDGNSAEVDLARAVTVNDVLDAINSASGISVSASVNGDKIDVRDTAAGAGAFTIENVFGAQTATSLGIAGSAAAGGTITSSSALLYLSENTPLSLLNDGNGISFSGVGSVASPDLRIVLTDAGTPGNSVTFNIALGELKEEVDGEDVVTHTAVATLGDLFDRIAEQTDGDVTASISGDGRSIVFTDATGDTNRTLSVVNSSDRDAATDLGVAGIAPAGAPGSQTVTGRRLIADINSRLALNLNGGSGISTGTFQVTRRDGTSFSVSVTQDNSVAEILKAINTAGGGTVTASLNRAGNGVKVTDSTTGGSLVIADTSGTAAEDLGIETAGEADGVVESGNLQHRYISGSRRVADLNTGKGIGVGKFRIIDSEGHATEVEVTKTNATTLDDLISLINSRPSIQVTASINATGDGIVLTDNAGGAQKLEIEDATGTVAKALNILGESESETPGQNKIDGSFERSVAFEATDTLQKVADKINAASVGVSAVVVNSGSGVSPFRLILTSQATGASGRFIVDGFDLGLDVVTEGADAVAFFGAGDSSSNVLLTSNTNTLDNVITGVTIDLKAVTDEPAQIVVSRDTAAIETAINAFIESFNNTLTRLDFHSRFDPETNQRGALLGDSTVDSIRSSLLTAVQSSATNVDGPYQRLFEVGIRIGAGARLEFNREKFREAYSADPTAVQNLVAAFEATPNEPTVLARDENGNPLITSPNPGTTYNRLGVAEQIELLTTNLTKPVDGTIKNKSNTLDTQILLLERRIEDFDVRLENRRVRLERQFIAMEQALAALQTQSTALSGLSSLARR